MLPTLTPAAERALSSATRWAEHTAAAVEPRHLLLAMLEEEEGRVASLLLAQGLSLPRVRDALAPDLKEPSATLPSEPQAPDPALHAIIYAARHWARELSEETTVATEHLLIACLEEGKPLAALFSSLGLNIGKLHQQLQRAPLPPLTLDEPLESQPTAENMSTARILDANANRAREALRVIEEHCRFVLDDALLTGQLKQLRHDLAEALAELPPTLLLAARETRYDVGTGLTTSTEYVRQTVRDVVRANCKRLQEALRALEEYGKMHGPQLGRALESIRYRVYTLERSLELGALARERLADVRLYVIVSGSLCTASVEWTIQEAAAGGARAIQLREKKLGDRDLLARARDVRRWTRAAGVLFIMNDRPDIAALAEADGVHVGQDELRVNDVRRIVGPHMLIGVSTHNLEQLRQAILDGASYVGVGPTFTSATKEFGELAGLDFVRQASAETTLPAFAIGGIGPGNIDQVLAAGLKRVAVSHAICTADEPRLVAVALRQALDEAGKASVEA